MAAQGPIAGTYSFQDMVAHLVGPGGMVSLGYGSGAAGGVVNIITKAPTDKLSGSVTLYTEQPEDRDEGDTKRVGFNLAGPLMENFSFRLFGNYNRTDADSLDLNREAAIGELLNTVLGNATTDLQHLHRRGISMTTPVIVGSGQTILPEHDDVFYTRGLRTPSGRLAIILIGPNVTFGASGF